MGPFWEDVTHWKPRNATFRQCTSFKQPKRVGFGCQRGRVCALHMQRQHRAEKTSDDHCALISAACMKDSQDRVAVEFRGISTWSMARCFVRMDRFKLPGIAAGSSAWHVPACVTSVRLSKLTVDGQTAGSTLFVSLQPDQHREGLLAERVCCCRGASEFQCAGGLIADSCMVQFSAGAEQSRGDLTREQEDS
jgi:hypothetical protein